MSVVINWNFSNNLFFPEELAINILSRLEVKNLFDCQLVCKNWNMVLAIHEKNGNAISKLWQQAVERNPCYGFGFYEWFINMHCENEEFKKRSFEILTKVVRTSDQIVERIKNFLKEIELNQKGSFTCLMPNYPMCGIRIVIASGKNIAEETSPEVKELVLFDNHKEKKNQDIYNYTINCKCKSLFELCCVYENDNKVCNNNDIKEKPFLFNFIFSPWPITNFGNGQLLKLYQIRACLPATIETSFIEKINEIVENKYSQIKAVISLNN